MAYDFNGSTQAIHYPQLGFTGRGGTGAMTFASWARPQNTSTRMVAYCVGYNAAGTGPGQNNQCFIEFNGPSFSYSPTVYAGSGIYPPTDNRNCLVGRDADPTNHFTTGVWYGTTYTDYGYLTATRTRMSYSGYSSAAPFDNTASTNSIGAPHNQDRTSFGADNYSNAFHQYFNGGVCKGASWDAALTDREMVSYNLGFSPLRIRPQKLLAYAPLINALIDPTFRATFTNVNTATRSRHPRSYGF